MTAKQAVSALLARTGVRMRTTVVAILALALALLTAGIVLVMLLHQSLDGTLTESARSTAREVAKQISVEGGRDLGAEVAAAGDTEAVTQVLGATGRPLAGDPAIAGRGPLTSMRPAPGHEEVETLPLSLDDDDSGYRVVTWGVAGPGGPYTVISARSLGPADDAAARLGLLLAVAFFPLLGISGLAVHRAVGSALRPVERMRRTVAEISTRDLDLRVGLPPGRDEIYRLATTLNTMLDRLASAQAAQRRFVADASHELRSPLSTISTALEVSARHPDTMGQDELAPLVTRETARLRELVDDLLMLARTDDASDNPSRAEVDLDDLVRTEAGRVRDGGMVEVEVRARPAKVRGNEAQLRRAVRNLVDNARDHARKRIRVCCSVSDGVAVVEVADDGPGVAEADAERVFERFVRLDAARGRSEGGTGLGLPIVAGIAARHGGSARCVTKRESEVDYPGALFRLEIPANDEDG